MGVFGFGNVGGAVADETTAGFPTSGLVALYKCDERTGDKLYDATGNVGPIVLNTGVALNTTNVANLCYINDMTFAGLLDDEAANFTFGFEGVSPALGASGGIHELISGNAQSTAPVRIFMTETAGFAAANRFNIAVRVLTNEAAVYTVTAAVTHFAGIPASTPFQLVLRHYGTGVVPYVVFAYRLGCTGPWTEFTVASSAGSGTYTLNDGGITSYTALVRGTATAPYLGYVKTLFLAQGSITLATAKEMLLPDSAAAVQTALGTNARYWSFEKGSGTVANEYITGTTPTISTAGTVTWGNAVAGINQTALRQGIVDGPAGVRIGGESGFAPGVGYGTTAASDVPILSNPAGWTVIATLRTGNRIPSTDQYLFSVYGANLDGSYSTTPTLQPGAHLVLDDAGLIRGVWKNATKNTAAAGTEQAAGVTADSPSNGLLGTYAIVCSSAGAVTTRRILNNDTSVTTEATATAADHVHTKATRVAIGNASFGADLVIGFGAIYERPLTDAEIAQIHRASLARMRGAEITVLAAATAGNGTPRYPYGVMTSAMRVMQPGQIVNVGAGTYKRISNNQPAALFPSSSTNIWIKGAGMTTTIIQADASGVGNHPVELNAGSWRFSDCKFDARNISNSAVTTGTVNTVDSLIFDRCWFYDALVGSSTGTGLVTRAKYVELNDCESSHNGEHGVYLRIASQDEGDHRAVIRGLYCHDNTEDGLKFAADLHPTNMTVQTSWAECIVDRLKVDGGLRQLWLGGIRDSVITNILLLNSTNTGGTPGALRLGHPTGTDTAEIEDGCWNNTIANITIVGADGYAVYDARSEGTVIKNLILSGNANDYAALSEGSAVITYAAGDDPDYPLPTHATNILGATIAFTNTGTGDYSLTAGSDGTGDGENLTGLSDEAESTYAGVARPTTGAWNMGAY